MKLAKNKKKGLCKALRCKSKAAYKQVLCHRHKAHQYREKHPIEFAYQQLRANARRRGHTFTLTVEEFRTFCEATGYLKHRGRKRNQCGIDRIDPTKGYSFDNIQMLTCSDNSAKQFTDMAYF